MKPLNLLNHPSPDQPVAVIGHTEEGDPSLPVVVMIHGTFRRASVLAPWAYRLDAVARVLLLDVPGHGQSLPLFPPSLEELSRAIGKAASIFTQNRPVILVGESLGGLIALKLGAGSGMDIRHVIAFDPPLTTSKLWSAQANIQRLSEHRELSPFEKELTRQIFGVTIGAPEIEERIYYDVVDRCRVGATIVTGDNPLFPPRPNAGSPCLFDAVDRYVVQRLKPDISIRTVAGAGHALLSGSADACQPIIEDIIGRCAAG